MWLLVGASVEKPDHPSDPQEVNGRRVVLSARIQGWWMWSVVGVSVDKP